MMSTDRADQRKTLDVLKYLDVGSLTFVRSSTSSVTSAWGVQWSPEFIARDLLQNFRDANVGKIDQISIDDKKDVITIKAPAQFNLEHLYYIGSEKDDEKSIGQYGEGYKVACVCLLRDHRVTPIAASGRDVVLTRLAAEPVAGTTMYPLEYDFYQAEKEIRGSALVLTGCSAKLINAVKDGLSHFFYSGNRFLGKNIWYDERQVSGSHCFELYSSSGKDGCVFYRGLRRATLHDFPVVVVINKKINPIEMLIANDRDRNAFGEKVINKICDHFFRTAAKSSIEVVKHVLIAGKEHWIGGHVLLSSLANHTYTPWGSAAESFRKEMRNIFGENIYFARSNERGRNYSKDIEVGQLENKWRSEGRTALPSYFAQFSVVTANGYINDQKRKVVEEERNISVRRTTSEENKGLKILAEAAISVSPFMRHFIQNNKLDYSVCETDHILGLMKKDLGYKSRSIYLASSVFESPIGLAFSTFVHEHLHCFGNDGSREFTDALTEMIEMVIDNHDFFSAVSQKWKGQVENVKNERSAMRKSGNDEEDMTTLITSLDEKGLRGILRNIPQVTIQTALKRAKNSNNPDAN